MCFTQRHSVFFIAIQLMLCLLKLHIFPVVSACVHAIQVYCVQRPCDFLFKRTHTHTHSYPFTRSLNSFFIPTNLTAHEIKNEKTSTPHNAHNITNKFANGMERNKHCTMYRSNLCGNRQKLNIHKNKDAWGMKNERKMKLAEL